MPVEPSKYNGVCQFSFNLNLIFRIFRLPIFFVARCHLSQFNSITRYSLFIFRIRSFGFDKRNSLYEGHAEKKSTIRPYLLISWLLCRSMTKKRIFRYDVQVVEKKKKRPVLHASIYRYLKLDDKSKKEGRSKWNSKWKSLFEKILLYTVNNVSTSGFEEFVFLSNVLGRRVVAISGCWASWIETKVTSVPRNFFQLCENEYAGKMAIDDENPGRWCCSFRIVSWYYASLLR